MERMWWESNSKAAHFLGQIVRTAAGGESVIISLPDRVPWKETMVSLLSERLLEEMRTYSFKEITNPPADAGAYVLDEFCQKELREKYRFSESYARFLSESTETVLNNRVILVSGLNEETARGWIAFASEYARLTKGKKAAVFLLEIPADMDAGTIPHKGLKLIEYRKNITAYDRFAFCTMAAADTACPDHLKMYLALMAAALCGDDVELCAACAAEGSTFLRDPVGTMRNVAENKLRSDGTSFILPGDEEQVKTWIWEVQVRTIFPLIEQERSKIVRGLRDQLIPILPEIVGSMGEEIKDPDDVEIGPLYFLLASGKLTVKQEVYNRVRLLRETRNSLAHLDALGLTDVETILKMQG